MFGLTDQKTIRCLSIVLLIMAVAGCTRNPPSPESGRAGKPADTRPDLDRTARRAGADGDVLNAAMLPTRDLIDEARTLACTGAKQYMAGNYISARANLDAALFNLQLADLPEDLQRLSFLQPFLAEDCSSVNIEKTYQSLIDSSQNEEAGIALDESVQPRVDSTGLDRPYIEAETRRLITIFGEDSLSADDFDSFVNEIEGFIQYFQTDKRDWFERAYYRMMKYRPMIEGIFGEKKLPSEIVYLAFIESAFSYRATSTAKARGIWQMMPGTAEMYGLKVKRNLDERLDPIKSTIAAREYLSDLIAIFGSKSFLLAMASYNAGEGKVQRCLRKVDDPYEDRSFWRIRDCLRQETRDYIPLIMAAGIICENPKRFGFELMSREDLYTQRDVVVCEELVRFQPIAQAAGISVDDLMTLNTDLPSGATWTPVKNTHLWIPKAAKESVAQVIARSEAPPPPQPEPSSGAEFHTVKKGENLFKIGKRYNIPHTTLAKWNDIKPPYSLKVGQKIYLTAPDAAPSTDKSVPQVNMTRCTDSLVYVVQKGNYLAGIASMFGITPRDIMSANKLNRGMIHPGQRLVICPAYPIEVIIHTIAANDTLPQIAKRYAINVEDLLFVNGLEIRQKLVPGSELTIYRRAS